MTGSMIADPFIRLAAFINSEHFRYRRFADDAHAGEFVLPTRARLVIDAPWTPLIEQTVADFTAYCAQCMQVTLTRMPSAGEIHLRLRSVLPGSYDVLSPAGEAFSLTISEAGVLLEADHERGLLHGTHYLEHLMADRGGPFLPYGQRDCTPAFMPRLTQKMPVPLSDEYLSLMSHYGANGMLLGANLLNVCRGTIIPELNSPDALQRIATLNERISMLLRHGIDAYLHVSTNPLPAHHPALLAAPASGGAPYRVFEDMACQNVLCSSNEQVLAFYDEAIENLFRDVPDAAGAVVIIGGEGFMHCYTRPYGTFAGYSSCPHCQAQEPSVPVARLVNRIAAAVKCTGKGKPVFAWPYSAFTWSGTDRAQLHWMEQLSEDVLVLSNFDTNSVDEQNGAGVVLYDYNIKSVGPSKVFQAQAQKAREMGRRIYCKTESNATPSVFFIPYIPVHFRWHERFRAMAKAGVSGYMGQWGFYCMNATPPEEMQYHAIWNPQVDTEALLTTIAVRDFGMTTNDARQAVDAWCEMSNAWDDFPYSAMTNGEREFYMRGPLHYGPAHPLIFNVQNRYQLSQKFFGLSGDLMSLATPEEVAALLRDAKPRYVSELLLTLPYGVERYLELITRCRERWSSGLTALQCALGDAPLERARMELDVCALMDIHLVTIAHVVRFYATRERLWRTPVDIPAFREIMEELATILRAEIANAERSLPILERDFRIYTYDADMVREKIKQCRYVLEEELPLFSVTVRFHVWNDFP